MNSLTSTYRLSNGYEIPVVGFGTWQTPDGDVAVSSVKKRWLQVIAISILPKDTRMKKASAKRLRKVEFLEKRYS